MEPPMTFALAAVSAFAAGVLFQSEGWPRVDRERGWRLLIRLMALVVMVASAFGASSLFGTEGSFRAIGVAATVLWLPQFLLMLVFARGTAGQPAPRPSGQDG